MDAMSITWPVHANARKLFSSLYTNISRAVKLTLHSLGMQVVVLVEDLLREEKKVKYLKMGVIML